MAEMMQCIVCHGPGDCRPRPLEPWSEFHYLSPSPGDYRLEQRAVPEVGPEEVLVRVLAVGICAGDAKCFAGAPYFWGEPCSRTY